MPLPDLGALADAGGWVVAIAIAIMGYGLIVTGKLVPGPTHDREVGRADKQDARLDVMTELLREATVQLDKLATLLEDRRRHERDP